uniref:Uncharacterized protein n=1 Tax=Panagrolaimus davidi TaxID=227884 RepID=A0A914QDU9_9BILA
MVPHRWLLEPTHVAGTLFLEKDFVQIEKKDVPYSFNCMNSSLEEIPPLYHIIIEDKKTKIVAADGEYLKECKLLYDEVAVAGVVTKKHKAFAKGIAQTLHAIIDAMQRTIQQPVDNDTAASVPVSADIASISSVQPAKEVSELSSNEQQEQSSIAKNGAAEVVIEEPAKEQYVNGNEKSPFCNPNEKKQDEEDDPERLLIAENVLASGGGAKGKEKPAKEISKVQQKQSSMLQLLPQLIEIHSLNDETYRGNFGGVSMKQLVKNLKKTDIKTRETPVYKDTYPLMDEMKLFVEVV